MYGLKWVLMTMFQLEIAFLKAALPTEYVNSISSSQTHIWYIIYLMASRPPESSLQRIRLRRFFVEENFPEVSWSEIYSGQGRLFLLLIFAAHSKESHPYGCLRSPIKSPFRVFCSTSQGTTKMPAPSFFKNIFAYRQEFKFSNRPRKYLQFYSSE